MPLVSVVIAARNQADALAHAVNSVLAQTHDRVELIVVDDGSTDGTPAVMRSFEERPEVTAVRLPRRGLPAARNRGLAEAHGEFVCFVDTEADLAPSHLEQLVQPLFADELLAFSYCDVKFADDDDAALDEPGDLFELLLSGRRFPLHAGLVRRKVLNEVGGFAEDLGRHADYELWLRLAAEGRRTHRVPDLPGRVRGHLGNDDADVVTDRVEARHARVKVLERIVRRYPARVAAGLQANQELTDDLLLVNSWLRSRWEGLLREVALTHAPARWSLLNHVDDLQVLRGTRDQVAVWEVAIAETLSRTLHLHAPATVEVSIPSGESGRLVSAVALHPRVWDNPRAGACIFSITVDGVVTTSEVLHPSAHDVDRRWVPIALDIPASGTGHHVVRLDTETIGPPFFAWALFRDVRFQATTRGL
ncbi:MAG: glycosyltransferase [Acidobacteriota bacterium]